MLIPSFRTIGTVTMHKLEPCSDSQFVWEPIRLCAILKDDIVGSVFRIVRCNDNEKKILHNFESNLLQLRLRTGAMPSSITWYSTHQVLPLVCQWASSLLPRMLSTAARKKLIFKLGERLDFHSACLPGKGLADVEVFFGQHYLTT